MGNYEKISVKAQTVFILHCSTPNRYMRECEKIALLRAIIQKILIKFFPEV